MAVCNLFNTLSNASGNFLLFSQYVEDITHDFVENDNWKVVPSKFVAFNIDYSKIDKDMVLPNAEDLNIGIPKYFQNRFENACAWGREHYSEWAEETGGQKSKDWTPEISRNLFWNSMFDGGFLHASQYGSTKKLDELMYYGNISMHSYNEHKGMGYGEIYCYIPTDGPKMNCQVVLITDGENDGRKSELRTDATFLEGYTDKYVENYIQEYFYNRDFTMSFDDANVGTLLSGTESSYKVNTIVVLYDVMRRLNDSWETVYGSIPMGMYIAGRFNDDGSLTNEVTKYVTTSYGTGTSYGLRLCTRFSANPNEAILKETEITTDDSNYTSMTQLMTAMNENLSRMLDVSKSAVNTTQQYKDLLSIFKNSKTNVPYVKDINGTDWWFVNGKPVSAVTTESVKSGCVQLSPDTVQKRLDNLMDNNANNDWSYIEDPNGCNCFPISNWDLAEQLGLDPSQFPEYGGGSTGGDSGASGGCACNFEIATAEDVQKDIADVLNRYV